jgi:hypothetical protein
VRGVRLGSDGSKSPDVIIIVEENMYRVIAVCLILCGILLVISCSKDDSPTGFTIAPPDTLWSKFFGGYNWNYGYKVLEGEDGGFLLLGGTFSEENPTGWLLKTDENGDSLWKQEFNFSETTVGIGLKPTYDGGYIITGYSGSDINYTGVSLIKTDAYGNFLWNKVLVDSLGYVGYDIEPTIDGSYIIVAQNFMLDNQPNESPTLLLKADQNGDLIWSRGFDGFHGIAIVEAWDANYVVMGKNNSSDDELRLMKTDTEGEPLWIKTHDIVDSGFGYSLEETVDRGFVIGGACINIGEGSSFFLLKTDPEGIQEWTNTYSKDEFSFGKCARQTSDGGYILAGRTGGISTPTNSDYDALIIRTNSMGFELWSVILSVSYKNDIVDIRETVDGGYIFTGAIGNAAWLARLEAD